MDKKEAYQKHLIWSDYSRWLYLNFRILRNELKLRNKVLWAAQIYILTAYFISNKSQK